MMNLLAALILKKNGMKTNFPTMIIINRIAICIILFSVSITAATVDTVLVNSAKMDTAFKAIVVLPENYKGLENKSYPVVYLLHGWSGKYDNWAKKTDLGILSDQYEFIIVCPDGGYAGWYLDSPINKESQYETYIAKEVVQFVDSNYRTISETQGRFVCGLSMGGHGAISLLAKYPGTYAAAGSMSGVMHLNDSTQRYGIIELLGEYEKNKDQWEKYSAINQIEKLAGHKKGILIDCGIEDRFIESNRAIHKKLMDLNIKHVYIERPGGHSWDYWTNALEYHLLFFKKTLNKSN